MISNVLQILGLQPQLSKVFLHHSKIFFQQYVRTILVTKYHWWTQPVWIKSLQSALKSGQVMVQFPFLLQIACLQKEEKSRNVCNWDRDCLYTEMHKDSPFSGVSDQTWQAFWPEDKVIHPKYYKNRLSDLASTIDLFWQKRQNYQFSTFFCANTTSHVHVLSYGVKINSKTDMIQQLTLLANFLKGGVHGLRTPNEGMNQRYLKNWADVADKICCRHT